MKTKALPNQQTDNQVEKWFDDIVSTLRVHELQLSTNTASEERKKIYDVFMSGNEDNIHDLSRKTSQAFFVKKILLNYISVISDIINDINHLAFAHNDAQVYVWAEINDDDESIEADLYLAAAQVNADFHDYGYGIQSTIVESCDELSIPVHYTRFK